MPTSHFCSGAVNKAKVLVIGHDPRLQDSDTLAGNAFFGDYFFNKMPTRGNELAKYKLAEVVYGYIAYLTSYRFSADQIILTNLCNDPLPHSPKGKTVYIPEDKALRGIGEIQGILNSSEVEVIFAMSAQVNYWLQKLGFYPAVPEYLVAATPKPKGIVNERPFYDQSRSKAFTLICGKQYFTKENKQVYPILHVKNWPLKGPFVKAYKKLYEQCVNSLK
jgi:hypothetical protein